MNKNTWIIIFFLVLGAHLIGIRLSGRVSDVQRKGGRTYTIALPKTADRDKVRKDLMKEFSGATPDINFIGENSNLYFATSYMINKFGDETDSIVFAKLMHGLRNYLPEGITYRMFDSTYKLESRKELPSAPALEPAWFPRKLYPVLLYVCKALLIPLLLVFFLVSVNVTSSPLKKRIIGALLFSWVGDVLLLFVPKNELFFLLGLGSFLLAHIFYIGYFHRVRVREKIKGKPWLLVIVAVYYGVLITLLFPHLGEMKLPVLIYGLVISIMFLLAMHMLFIANRTAGRYMMTGALLFVLSDSILAINKFYQPFEMAGILIMVTYGLAQFFIVKGAAVYTAGPRSGDISVA